MESAIEATTALVLVVVKVKIRLMNLFNQALLPRAQHSLTNAIGINQTKRHAQGSILDCLSNSNSK